MRSHLKKYVIWRNDAGDGKVSGKSAKIVVHIGLMVRGWSLGIEKPYACQIAD